VLSAPPRPLPPAFPGEIERCRLANGLELCLLRNRQAPIVSTALFYRAGCRDEPRGAGGLAHFLEHMMFKGSERFGPGEVDRRTQALGGTNNAFTSHDVTAYWFSFAADRWPEALAIEADRMHGLRLDAEEVDAERRVIVEEIAMYEDEPWDALELAVMAELFAGHPYARPVLGTAEELAAAGRDELATFHRRYYRPDNAVLVVAGDLGADARARIEDALGGLAAGAGDRPIPPAPTPRPGMRRLDRHQGEIARLMLALPAPAACQAEHAEIRLLSGVLADGRASRLQRVLVEEGQLCLGVGASVADSELTSHLAITAELLPDADPGEVEGRLLAELARLRAEPPGVEEIERARNIFLSEWVFGVERIHQQAVAAGVALAQFDLDQPARLLARVAELDADALCAAAGRWLDPERAAVFGRCLPESEPAP